MPHTTFRHPRISYFASSARSGPPVVRGSQADSPHHLQSPCSMFSGKRSPSLGHKQQSGLGLAVNGSFCFPSEALAQQSIESLTQEVTDKKASSIWDWTPPGDLAETGTWKVLRELAGTLSKYTFILTTQPVMVEHLYPVMQWYSHICSMHTRIQETLTRIHTLNNTAAAKTSRQFDVHPEPFNPSL